MSDSTKCNKQYKEASLVSSGSQVGFHAASRAKLSYLSHDDLAAGSPSLQDDRDVYVLGSQRTHNGEDV